MTGNSWAIAGLYVFQCVLLYFIHRLAAPYLKTVGELTAREDKLDSILKEVRYVTTIQKQIESTISGELWNRKRAYELRRDAYIELLKTTGRLAVLTDQLPSVGRMTNQGAILPGHTVQYAGVTHRIDILMNKLNSQRYLYRVLLGEHVFERIGKLGQESAGHSDIRVALAAYEDFQKDIAEFARRDLSLNTDELISSSSASPQPS